RFGWERGQRAVEEAAAIAEPVVLRVDADEWRDHDIRDDGTALRRDRDVPDAFFEAIARPVGTEDERLRFLHHERQGGRAAARNERSHPGAQVRLAAKRPIEADRTA